MELIAILFVVAVVIGLIAFSADVAREYGCGFAVGGVILFILIVFGVIMAYTGGL